MQRRADEFAALHGSARALAIEQDLQALLRATVGQATRVTISVRIAQLGERDDDLQSVIGRTDQALYAANHSGRNRVEVG